MRSKHSRCIEVKKIGGGKIPPFLVAAQRVYEKSMPPTSGDQVTLTVSLDLLALTQVPQWLLKGIEEVQVTYRKRRS